MLGLRLLLLLLLLLLAAAMSSPRSNFDRFRLVLLFIAVPVPVIETFAAASPLMATLLHGIYFQHFSQRINFFQEGLHLSMCMFDMNESLTAVPEQKVCLLLAQPTGCLRLSEAVMPNAWSR